VEAGVGYEVGSEWGGKVGRGVEKKGRGGGRAKWWRMEGRGVGRVIKGENQRHRPSNRLQTHAN